VIEQGCVNGNPIKARVPEARYSYYRRCQMFRKNGEQCKAPAEKDAHICYAHAQQQAMTLRRKIETAVLLAEVVRRVRARGRPDFEVADIFLDFDAIQITLAVMAQAVIEGRIDCKAAGRLMVGLQTAMKLLRMVHRKKTSTIEARRHGEQQESPQISADQRRLDRRSASTMKDAKECERQSTFVLSKDDLFAEVDEPGAHEAETREEDNVHLMNNLRSIEMDVVLRNGFCRHSAHAPPALKRAA
jgi:hypothetical protein